ncbi:BZ3500_MvSof-1268-A1-R1_Chr8-1g09820 [Microbotryum saponariae]|uniref:BZ3500_MvSof-1268-A1-R1_Chr8-1g09820 protein n=1 Tax=Microbotryum saponariae TaxID=289078 RepID=A0A2X0NPF5_9BASI|nr:BZ3500_MvSof-1268-A1-R1_Chr8-1g09820 [Microbotryum saponariae]SDA08106.1 BZ3501_MvSof-1269-A2-R1_Chr8-1g09543 [Microbotryum saponariae]
MSASSSLLDTPKALTTKSIPTTTERFRFPSSCSPRCASSPSSRDGCSSSSPSSAASSLASSVIQSGKHRRLDMDIISLHDSSSSPPPRSPSGEDVEMEVDVQVLEDTSNNEPSSLSKRKPAHQPQQQDSITKKPKLLAEHVTPMSTPSKTASSENVHLASATSVVKSTTTTPKLNTTGPAASPAPLEPSLVDWVKGKFVVKQKPFEATKIPSAIERWTAFTAEFAQKFHSDPEFELAEYPQQHHAVFAAMINESTKTLIALSKSIRDELVKALDGAILGLAIQADLDDEDDDVDGREVESKSVLERVPLGPIKNLVAELAKRVNHGLDVGSLLVSGGGQKDEHKLDQDKTPSDLTGSSNPLVVPQGLQLWFWELNSMSLLPTELQARLTKRRNQRFEMGKACLRIWQGLGEEERKALLVEGNGAAGKNGEGGTSTVKEPKGKVAKTVAVASSSTANSEASGSGSAIKKKKVKTDEQLREIEDKRRKKEEEENEKAEKKAAREKVAAEKAAEKAAKEAKKAEKLAAEEKKRKSLSKSAGFMSAFVVKKTPSPAASNDVTANSAGQRVKESDFNLVFKDFNDARAGVEVAPINRFKKYRLATKGKLPEVRIDSEPTLSKQTALADLTKGVPARRIPTYHSALPKTTVSVRSIAEEVTQCAVTGGDPAPLLKILQDRRKVPVKLLKFHDDVRPGYVGTWTKWSRTIRPRAPLEVDRALINYEYDSEADWEEEDEDAEDLRSGDELSGEDNSDDDLSDDWLAGDDDVEYLEGAGSEDELRMDVDGGAEDLELLATRRRLERREKKGKARNKKEIKTLIPIVKGPCWETRLGVPKEKMFESMRIQFLNGQLRRLFMATRNLLLTVSDVSLADAHVGIDPFRWESKPLPPPTNGMAAKGKGKAVADPTNTDMTAPGQTGGKKKAGGVSTIMSDGDVARMISLIHGSEMMSKIKLLEGVVEKLNRSSVFKVPKLTVQTKWGELDPKKVESATIKGKKVWDVDQVIRAKYGVA